MSTYGSFLYGTGVVLERIPALFKTAQSSAVRQTGLKVQVLDLQINRWSELAGTGISTNSLPATTAKVTAQSYRSYRLQMGMCILTNGTIVRVRVGDGTSGNWNIYKQEITDPTVAAQWTSWTLAYSGTHYAVAVVPATASTYHIYSAKSDGVYKNNVKKQSITGVIKIDPIKGQIDAMFVTHVRGDVIDGRQVNDHYYSSNIETTAFSDDAVNYRWIRSEIDCLKLADGRIARAQIAGFYINPRSTNLAESLTISFAPSYTSIEPNTPPIIVRGFAGQAGSNAIHNMYLTQMVDGYYYLFYSEHRYDYDKSIAISAANTVFWQRSINLIHWSEPVAIGFDNMNPTGIAVVEKNGYAYLANNGAVYSRPTATQTYDLSNYVNHVELGIPGSNQEGSGSFPVANPAGIHNVILDLTDCEVKIEAGLRCSDGVYRYVEFGRWWINRVIRSVDRETNRLSVNLYDLWRRLDNKLRDNYNNVGQLQWADWKVGTRSQLYNYYTKGGTFKTVSTGTGSQTYRYVNVLDPTNKNFILFTGWKGHNGEVRVRFRCHPTDARKIGLVYRYKDANNYYWVYASDTHIRLARIKNGKTTILASKARNITGWFFLKVVFRWGIHRVYYGDTLDISYNEGLSGDSPGYAGVRGIGNDYRFDNYTFTDWQPKRTTNDLITSLLAMGDLHSPSVSGGETPQLSVVWGPQTELNTPSKALQNLCSTFKLELAWRGGRVEVGQFKEKTIVGTFQNEIISATRTEEIGKRINLASVDGRDDSWIEIDGEDTRFRGRQIVEYFDVPDLVTDDQVRNRAVEEIRKGVVGTAYEAELPLQFDLWRMDGITVIDNLGTSKDLKVEGIEIEIEQGTEPKQRMKLDLSPLT